MTGLQNFYKTGGNREFTLGRHKQNLACTRTQGKGAVTPQETESDLPARAGGSPIEAWVGSGLPGGQALAAAALGGARWCEPSGSSPFTLPQSLQTPELGPLRQLTGRGHNLIHRQLGSSFTQRGPAHPSKTQFPCHHCSHQEAYTSLLGSSTRGQTEDPRTTSPRLPERKPYPTISLIIMKRQRVMSQIKGQDKTPEKQLNEVEIDKLPGKEFRIIIIKMIQDLRKKIKK